MQYLGAISKATEWFWFVSKAKQLIITVIQVYVRTTNAKEAEVEQFYEDLQDFKKLTDKKDVHYRELECKVGSQEIPGVTGKFGLRVRNETGQRLTEFCQENALVIANTLFQQHKYLTAHGKFKFCILELSRKFFSHIFDSWLIKSVNAKPTDTKCWLYHDMSPDDEVNLPVFKSCLHLLMWPWTGYLTSQSLHFPIH